MSYSQRPLPSPQKPGPCVENGGVLGLRLRVPVLQPLPSLRTRIRRSLLSPAAPLPPRVVFAHGFRSSDAAGGSGKFSAQCAGGERRPRAPDQPQRSGGRPLLAGEALASALTPLYQGVPEPGSAWGHEGWAGLGSFSRSTNTSTSHTLCFGAPACPAHPAPVPCAAAASSGRALPLRTPDPVVSSHQPLPGPPSPSPPAPSPPITTTALPAACLALS